MIPALVTWLTVKITVWDNFGFDDPSTRKKSHAKFFLVL